MNNLLWGIVDTVSDNRAFVRLRGESVPLITGMEYPKGQNPVNGDKVLIGMISGIYIIIAIYN